MTTSAETAARSSNELNTFSTKPSIFQSISEDYILLIYDFHESLKFGSVNSNRFFVICCSTASMLPFRVKLGLPMQN